jgi:hypothetical protein
MSALIVFQGRGVNNKSIELGKGNKKITSDNVFGATARLFIGGVLNAFCLRT